MEEEYTKIKQAIDNINVIDFLKQSDKLHLVSFISQFPLPIAIFDRNSRFLGVNQKFSDIYESDALYLFDKLLNTFSSVVHAQFQEALHAFEHNLHYSEQVFYVKGKFYLSYFKPMHDQNNHVEMIMLVCSDVTRLKRRENVLLFNNQKLHDHLYLDFVTGLQNKMAFDYYVNELFQKKSREDCSFLKIDLDDFKRFNQLHSYTNGDEVLSQLGALLNETIAYTEAKIFRLNSASFVVVITNLTEWAVITLAERLKFTIADQQIIFEKADEYLTASIGVYHLNQLDSVVDLDVVQKLNEAVRRAKIQGKNELHVLKDKM
ncbi:GGDEF domain-containing protein [Acinetobacter piscicola]|uniref:GGDEF domain-containing protein n=1 Tax=Acinetobacter piscicola TaxID=2006115 RepID=UPI000B7E8345|nr:sensor domain-containing diguanylate cyclase [Acinetobacter piscicola]